MKLKLFISKYVLIIFILICFGQPGISQKKTDANVVGHVKSNEIHIPFVTVTLKGTTIGTTTDESGHYMLLHLPVGKHILIAQALGYKAKEIEINIKQDETKVVNFDLEEDVLELEQIVVSSDRNSTKRKDASIIVNTINPKLFNLTQSLNLSEGMNYSTGLRIENNCQNCGFNQVRMNGMEGQYSQILINSRPIFSGLAGVYGLELIPTNMIERVEIIRGGSSALYGSNAIAGTINLILKDPIHNFYEIGAGSRLTGVGVAGGELSLDHNFHANTSMVSADSKTGVSIYGFYRNKDPFDANGDGFSELARINNITLGTRAFHRFGVRNKLSFDFFYIKEGRRGGNKFDYPAHEADIAEAINHKISTTAFTYDQLFRVSDILSVFVSGQTVNRGSYYGAEQSLTGYGNTKDLTFTGGAQYKTSRHISDMTFGFEATGENLIDEKLGYPDLQNALIINDTIVSIPHTNNVVIADQKSRTVGAYFQAERRFGKIKLTAGIRYDHYQIINSQDQTNNTKGNVFIPRINFLYDISMFLQARLSYSQGYRAPQIFNEDLHIETSGSRQVIHKNAPGLREETSRSYMLSFDINNIFSGTEFDILVEGFYTRLIDPFAYIYGTPDENGVVEYTRINSDADAVVNGVNLEFNFIPSANFYLKSGFTFQKSEYEEPQEFNEKRFFRTPNSYGFLTLEWKAYEKLGFSATGNYTGKMLIPYFGPEISDPDQGELRESNPFLDIGLKVYYNIKLNGATLQLFTGIKNIMNSYQSDFDTGINRDPGYIYGPTLPRTIYFGIKFGNSIL